MQGPSLLVMAVFAWFVMMASAASSVTRSGNQLLLDGKPFYHLGFNAVWMPSAAAFGQHQRIDDTLDAAQRIGLKVLRCWGFNSGVPYEPGRYDVKKAQGLDYVIAGAAQRGLRVELAIANFWPAYHGPEKWLLMAYGGRMDSPWTSQMAGLTVADFYRNEKVLALLKQHIIWLTSRVNTYTNVTFEDDPTIMGYNIFNEARCPGCTSADMVARNNFISALADTVRAAVPKQLTFSGTEGFFAAGDPNVGYNPGAGTQCEGEDWTHEIKLFDVATVHVYWRQMESLRQTNWTKPGFEFYIQYLHHKLKLYTELAAQARKPLVIEEFGLTKRFFTLNETKVVFAVVADAMIAAKRAGKPLMGAWLWQAAPIGESDIGGYDVTFNNTLSNAPIGLGNPPLALGTTKSPADLALTADRWQAGFQNGGAAGMPSPCDEGAVNVTTAAAATTALRHTNIGAAINIGATNTNTSSSNSTTGASRSAPPTATASSSAGTTPQTSKPASNVVGSTLSVLPGETANARPTSADPGSWSASQAFATLFNDVHGTSSSTGRSVVGRRLLGTNVIVMKSDDALDYFRQGDKRMECSNAVTDWLEPEIPFVLDVQAYYDMVKNHEIVDILAEAARLLSNAPQPGAVQAG